jgi:hypothetical protein
MHTRRLVVMVLLLFVACSALFAQFKPRKDYVWARDISVAASPTITLDGSLTEAVWAKAESVVVAYGTRDGNPGSGYKIMNGSGTPYNGANAVLKFLVNKTTNMLYVAVIAKDSSVGGNGWENSDGILAGFYNRADRSATLGITLHQDCFITYVDSAAAGALMNLKGGNLPGRNIVKAALSVSGTANVDTAAGGARVADQGWTLEMSVALDSIGYTANTATTDAVEMTACIWDGDWTHGGGTNIATRAWWGSEWGNSGGGLAGRVLVRSDVNVNTATLPTEDFDGELKNAVNFTAPVIDGDLRDTVWSKVDSLAIQYGNATLRATYGMVGKDRSGNFMPKGTTAFDAGYAYVKAFFKGDILYLAASVNDKSLNSYASDDFFDGIQLNFNAPVDSLYNKDTHVMGGYRFGVAIDTSASKARALWDLIGDSLFIRAVKYGAKLKTGSTVNDNTNVDAGYTVELSLDLSKLGYSAGQTNKVVAFGVNYHDYDMATDTVATRTWWFREWPWSATPAFMLLDNSSILTGVEDQQVGVAGEFRLMGNYPNPFNPSTKIQFRVPESGMATLQVFDVLGRMVKEVAQQVDGGTYEQTFNASSLSSGVYFYRVEFTSRQNSSHSMSQTKTMLLLK